MTADILLSWQFIINLKILPNGLGIKPRSLFMTADILLAWQFIYVLIVYDRGLYSLIWIIMIQFISDGQGGGCKPYQ